MAEIKSRGQLTIPKKIRDMSHLEEGQVVSIIPVGDSVIITPKRLELDEARRQIRKIVKASGLSERKNCFRDLKKKEKNSIKKPMARKRLRFFDSNVIISGLFSDKGSPRIVLDLLSLDLPLLSGATGEYNIVEIERNLLKKMPDVLPVYRRYLKYLTLRLSPCPLI